MRSAAIQNFQQIPACNLPNGGSAPDIACALQQELKIATSVINDLLEDCAALDSHIGVEVAFHRLSKLIT